ncbi:MAG TPA: FkbM family methyltransferase, partial [Jatrophihabitans sp.]
ARRAWADGEIADKLDYIARMHESHSVLFSYADLLQQTDIEKIEITDEGVVMTWRDSGVKLAADRVDQRIAPVDTLNFSKYEPEETAMLLRLVSDGDVFWDIGANHGWYVANFALRYPNVRIEAFEPVPKTYAALERNVARNGIEQQVNLHKHGFSNEPGEATFFFYAAGGANGSLRDLSGREDVQEIKVEMRLVDDLVDEGTPLPDFIKIDVEGAELLVLQGAVKTLEASKAPVFAELLRKWSKPFGYQPQDVITLMAGIGYRCFTIHDGKLVATEVINDDTVETNFLFLHTERSASDIADLERY